jgi:energy-coupling factor transport system ATP-binding protein
VALAAVDRLSFTYPFADRPALVDLSLELAEGEVVALLGRSGSGKSSLLRALAGLVPHFHGGTFAGRVVVAGQDTRLTRPADLAGTVATVFQDPEDQVVFTRVAGEVAFGLENVGTPPCEIQARAEAALTAVGALHLADRRVEELSGGELQRVCLASALALRPRLLLLDEPTSQLDPGGADAFLDAVQRLGTTVVLSEQRVARALAFADRVLFLDEGRLVLDAPRREAIAWLDTDAPTFSRPGPSDLGPADPGTPVVSLSGIGFSYRPGVPVLAGASLELRRGEVVVLEGPNGAGKTTLAKIAAGLLEPDRGNLARAGRAGYLSQDPGRYVVCEHALDELALAVGGDRDRARAALDRVGLGWAADRHPRDLSTGERERLGLAAVAVAEPDLLVLDEPTRGVDPERGAELAAWLHAYARAGRGVLVATHERAFPAHRRVALGAVEARLAA